MSAGRRSRVTDLSEPGERIRQLEADNARLTDRLSLMSDRSSRLTRDVTDFRSSWSRDFLSPGKTQRLDEDCRNLQRKVVGRLKLPTAKLRNALESPHSRSHRAF